MFGITYQHLYALIQASINIVHFPAPFKPTTTVILCKLVKPNYSKVNAYCPIALENIENTFSKLIESIISELLMSWKSTNQYQRNIMEEDQEGRESKP